MARKKEVSTVSTQDGKKATVADYALLKAPVITEKASMLGGDKRVAVFRIGRDVTKTAVRQAVERVYGVQVESVRTANYLGKVKRTSRSAGRRPHFKKAYVTLKPGQTIDIVEGV